MKMKKVPPRHRHQYIILFVKAKRSIEYDFLWSADKCYLSVISIDKNKFNFAKYKVTTLVFA